MASSMEKRDFLRDRGFDVPYSGKLSVEFEDIYTALSTRLHTKSSGIEVTEFIRRIREYHLNIGTVGVDRVTPLTTYRIRQYLGSLEAVKDSHPDMTVREFVESGGSFAKTSETELVDKDLIAAAFDAAEEVTAVHPTVEAEKMNRELFTGSARVIHMANKAYVELAETGLLEALDALGRSFDRNGIPLADCVEELRETAVCMDQASQFIGVLLTNVPERIRKEEPVVVLCTVILDAVKHATEVGGHPMYGTRLIEFATPQFDKLGWWVVGAGHACRIEGFSHDPSIGGPRILLHADYPDGETEHWWADPQLYSQIYAQKPTV